MATKDLPAIDTSGGGIVKADDSAAASTVAMRDNQGDLYASAHRASTGIRNSGYSYTGVSSKSASFTVDDTTNKGTVYLCDASGGAITVTLPAVASSSGKILTVVKTDATANVVLAGAGAETIDGATTKTITTQYGVLTVVCNGSAWFILASRGTIT